MYDESDDRRRTSGRICVEITGRAFIRATVLQGSDHKMENDLVSTPSVLSPADIVNEIYKHYQSNKALEELEWTTSKTLKLRIASWCQ